MGFDIELHIEQKIKGEWHYYGRVQVQRNYKFFNLLGFDDRVNQFEALFETKCPPADITVETQFWMTSHRDDMFQWNYLTSAEVTSLMNYLEENWETFFSPERTEIFGYFHERSFDTFIDPRYAVDWTEIREMGLEDFRIIYWFH